MEEKILKALEAGDKTVVEICNSSLLKKYMSQAVEAKLRKMAKDGTINTFHNGPILYYSTN